MTKRYFSHLGLTNAAPQRVAQAGMTVIDRLQNFRPHEQAMACAATFLLLCEEIGIEPQEVFVPVKNLLVDERNGSKPEFKALSMYIHEELAKQ